MSINKRQAGDVASPRPSRTLLGYTREPTHQVKMVFSQDF